MTAAEILADLDLGKYEEIPGRVAKTIHPQPNRVRHVMNGFVIGAGSAINSLTKLAPETGAKVGPVTVEMEGTACKVPYSPDYNRTVAARGSIGNKRRAARC